tara:strand:- start:124 stop:369 length:246 start_codon:yes stop_codon:yes gene_type:complete
MMMASRKKQLIFCPYQIPDAPAFAAALNDTGLNDTKICHAQIMVPCPFPLADAHGFIDDGAQDALAICTAGLGKANRQAIQ